MELKVLGKEQVGKFEFTGIEGGFGEGKKAMIFPDIAKIHGRSVRELNQIVSRNDEHFVIGVDLIDLKQITQSDLFLKFGFTKAQWGNAKHIWAASERGYLKLLKIMDDDKAWDIYNDIVDNYFNMRVAIKEQKPQIVEPSRLSIMHENAQTRKANALLKLVETAPDEVSKHKAWGKAYEALAGEPYLEQMTKKEYTATQLAKEFKTSKQMIGIISNQLGLKAEKPNSNQYGRYIIDHDKSGTPRDNWRYYEAAKKPIREELKNRKKGIYKEKK